MSALMDGMNLLLMPKVYAELFANISYLCVCCYSSISPVPSCCHCCCRPCSAPCAAKASWLCWPSTCSGAPWSNWLLASMACVC